MYAGILELTVCAELLPDPVAETKTIFGWLDEDVPDPVLELERVRWRPVPVGEIMVGVLGLKLEEDERDRPEVMMVDGRPCKIQIKMKVTVIYIWLSR